MHTPLSFWYQQITAGLDRLRLCAEEIYDLRRLFSDSEIVCVSLKLPLPASQRRTDCVLADLWSTFGLLFAESVPGEDEDTTVYNLVGSAQAIMEAENGVKQWSKSQGVSSADRRHRRLRLLEGCGFVETLLHESLVGIVIGKQGENLSRIARAYQVEIRVFPDENGTRRVRIYGKDELSLNSAKSEIEFQFCRLPLPLDVLNEVVLLPTITEIAHKSNIHSLWQDLQNSSLCICGTAKSINLFLKSLQFIHKGQQQHELTLIATPPKWNTATATAQPLLQPSPVHNEFFRAWERTGTHVFTDFRMIFFYRTRVRSTFLSFLQVHQSQHSRARALDTMVQGDILHNFLCHFQKTQLSAILQ